MLWKRKQFFDAVRWAIMLLYEVNDFFANAMLHFFILIQSLRSKSFIIIHFLNYRIIFCKWQLSHDNYVTIQRPEMHSKDRKIFL